MDPLPQPSNTPLTSSLAVDLQDEVHTAGPCEIRVLNSPFEPAQSPPYGSPPESRPPRRPDASAPDHVVEASHRLAETPTPNELRRLLKYINRDRLDVWVCDVCLCLHPNLTDSSPLDHSRGNSKCPRRGLARYDNQGCTSFQPVHVQLALKYMRKIFSLKPNHSRHLYELVLSEFCRIVQIGDVSVSVSMTPCIIEGRFLVYRDSFYLEPAVFPRTLRSRICRPCCHQHLMELESSNLTSDRPTVVTERSDGVSDVRPSEIETVCQCCRAEIYIHRSDQSTWTRVWEDFGTELSSLPLDCACQDDCEIFNRPASIRALFERLLPQPHMQILYRLCRPSPPLGTQ